MKTRIISAIVMIAVLLPILLLGGWYFKILVMVLGVGAMYELMKVRSNDKKIPVLLKVFAYLFIVAFLYFSTDFYNPGYTLDYRIFVALFLLLLIPIVFINDTKKYNISDALYLIGGCLFLSVSFNTFILIRNVDLVYLVYILLITIMTDTFAYVTGFLVGKHKLCEKISPNKTIEGSVGGSLIGTIIGTLFYLYVINGNINILLIVAVTLLFSVIGQIGDLLFSSIKRYYNVKDFSNLIPGHGGILDRCDSIIFVVITYIFFMNIL